MRVDLHRHLELSLRQSTIRELAPSFGIQISNDKEFAERFLITEPMKDLGAVLNKFLDTQKLLASEEILERIAFEACEDAFLKEQIRILELRYSLTFIKQGHDLSFEQIQKSIVRGVHRAENLYPIAVGLICIIQRILPVKEAEYVTDFAIEHKESFLALDLADNELGFDSKPFSKFFVKAKKAGMKITVHSGEANVEGAAQYVVDAIEHLGADRIGHGVQVYKNLEAMRFVRDRKIPLELCITSNVLTQAVPTFADHPFKKLSDFGIITTLNTDDPGIFNTDLNREIEVAKKYLNVTDDEIRKSFDRGAEVSFISLEKRQKVWPKSIQSNS